MGEFCSSTKNGQLYLDTAANGNGVEKTLFATEALRRLKATGRETIHLTEIGPGGGAAVNALVDQITTHRGYFPDDMSFSFIELDGIESHSLANARKRLDTIGPSSMIAGDAQYLDKVLPEGTDVVAASAIFHEIYSYAGGYPAIDNTINGISNTLRPGGFFAYRDVFSVDHLSQHEQANHVYDREGWIRFTKYFLPYYLASAKHPYHREDDMVTLRQDSTRVYFGDINPEKALSISAPVGVLRELQRHYITFRDHVWRADAIGLSPILEGRDASDWLDAKRGHKRVHFRSTIQDALLDGMSERRPDGVQIVDGDMFDASSDTLLSEFLQHINEPDSKQEAVWQEWLKREGSETYAYMTTGRFIGAVALRSIEASEGRTILLPRNPSDILIVPRAYYNRFLNHQLINPLPDGKQLVLFNNIEIRKHPEAVSDALEVVSQACPRDTLAKIYEPIAKIIR